MIEVVKFKITGISPVLMNSAAGMTFNRGTVKTQASIPTVEEDAEAGVYRLPNKHLYLLAEAFRSAIIKGGSVGKKIGKLSASRVAKAGFFYTDPECPLVNAKTGKPIKNYEVFPRSVVIQKARILRGRALIRDWSTTLVGEIDSSILGPDGSGIILELLNHGGKIDGVGDWRPEKGGAYGRFSAELL